MGMKGDGVKPWLFYVFTTKGDALEHLRQIVQNIQKEQRQGVRTADCLNPDTKLDFLIEEVSVNIPEINMKKRNWDLRP